MLNVAKHYSYIKIIFSVGAYTSTVAYISVETTELEFILVIAEVRYEIITYE